MESMSLLADGMFQAERSKINLVYQRKVGIHWSNEAGLRMRPCVVSLHAQ